MSRLTYHPSRLKSQERRVNYVMTSDTVIGSTVISRSTVIGSTMTSDLIRLGLRLASMPLGGLIFGEPWLVYVFPGQSVGELSNS